MDNVQFFGAYEITPPNEPGRLLIRLVDDITLGATHLSVRFSAEVLDDWRSVSRLVKDNMLLYCVFLAKGSLVNTLDLPPEDDFSKVVNSESAPSFFVVDNETDYKLPLARFAEGHEAEGYEPMERLGHSVTVFVRVSEEFVRFSCSVPAKEGTLMSCDGLSLSEE